MTSDTPNQFDADKFELVHQVGGIRTATYDWPDAGGAPGCRVAMVNTGSGLRFTVALDRGGDIVSEPSLPGRDPGTFRLDRHRWPTGR